MKTMTTIARIPLGYNDFGAYALSEAGEEMLECSSDEHWEEF